MRVRVLIENTALDEQLHAEHGLSLYIETDSHRILFDTGASEMFAENAALFGVRLEDVDICILSHGHYDHGGGLARFLEINDHAKIYMHRDAFRECYSGSDKYIGLNPALTDCDRIVFTDDECIIDSGMSLRTCNGMKQWHPMNRQGLTAVVNGQRVPDDFRHEQYLTVCENGRRIVFSGCSHKGILNIVKWMKPDVLVGGFHFMKLDVEADLNVLKENARSLSGGACTYYTGHCTGIEQYAVLKEMMGERLLYLAGGSEFVL